MVDAHIEFVFVIADAGSVATCAVAVGEILRDDAMAVGNGTVVEVATEDDAPPTILFEEILKFIDLLGTVYHGFREFFGNGFRGHAGRVAPVASAHDFSELVAIAGRQSRRCEVVVHDDDRIVAHFHVYDDRMTTLFILSDGFTLQDGIAAQDGDVVGATATVL